MKAAWRLRTTRASQGSRSTALARMARSKAVERWPGASRPFGLRQEEARRPSRADSASMARAKRATDPPAASASITATSLADTIIRALRACSTVSFWPRLTARRRAGWAAAALEATVTVSRSRLARTARAVSILVRLAGGAGVRLRRPQSTSPVAGSTRIAYLARTSFPGPGAGLRRHGRPQPGPLPAGTTRATSSDQEQPEEPGAAGRGASAWRPQCPIGRRAGQGRRSGYERPASTRIVRRSSRHPNLGARQHARHRDRRWPRRPRHRRLPRPRRPRRGGRRRRRQQAGPHPRGPLLVLRAGPPGAAGRGGPGGPAPDRRRQGRGGRPRDRDLHLRRHPEPRRRQPQPGLRRGGGQGGRPPACPRASSAWSARSRPCRCRPASGSPR